MEFQPLAGGFRIDNGASPVSPAETAGRFCPTCVHYHESRAMFLPAEAPDFIPPGCYYQGSGMASGWCDGGAYEEYIP